MNGLRSGMGSVLISSVELGAGAEDRRARWDLLTVLPGTFDPRRG
jgi:hypothetical protein